MTAAAKLDAAGNSAVAVRNVGSKNTNAAGVGAQNCNVALVGFGTVGSSVARILCERSNTHLRLTHILNRNVARKKVDWLPSSVQWTENIDDVLSSDADIVVEVMGGLQPTEDWIRRAPVVGQIGGHRQQAIDRALRPRIDRSGPPNETADPVWRIGSGRRARNFRIA